MTDLGSSGGWYVIAANSIANPVTVSQKPFPPGSVVQSGPYPTRALAQAAADKVNQTNKPPIQQLGIPNPFSWVGAVAHWIGDFTLSITDVHMWISLGWLVLGIGLIYFGFLLWLKVPQTAVSVAEGAAARA